MLYYSPTSLGVNPRLEPDATKTAGAPLPSRRSSYHFRNRSGATSGLTARVMSGMTTSASALDALCDLGGEFVSELGQDR
jgi:hypothetical protein